MMILISILNDDIVISLLYDDGNFVMGGLKDD